MRTTANAYIAVSGMRTGQPPPIIEAWANSSLAVVVEIGHVMQTVAMRVTDPSTGLYLSQTDGILHPVRGQWYFYLPKRMFPNGGEGLYRVYGTDQRGNRHMVCEGTLRVFRGRADEPSDEAGGAETVDNGYMRINGEWWRVEVSEDETGEPMFRVAQVLPEFVPSRLDGDVYAYNRRTGLYHKVSLVEDESGAMALQCADNGVDGDETTFAFDKVTNFYYRIECATDESGATMLQVGGRQT